MTDWHWQRKMGVTHALNTLDEDFEQQVEQIVGKKGFEYVFETAGATPTMHLAFKLASNKACVCFIGTPHADLTFTQKQWEQMNRKEFKLTGSWMSYSTPFPGREWELTAYYYGNGQLKFDDAMIYKKFPMSKCDEAFELYRNPRQVKGKILLINE